MPDPAYRTRIRALGGKAEGSALDKGQIEKKWASIGINSWEAYP